MDWLFDGLGAIAGLVLGSVIILLMAPALDSMTPVNLTGLGILLFVGAITLSVVLIIVATRALLTSI